jgi:glycine/D-amino acid oxidase-like deaminating enzyme/nitrite reductase/ring-hydroxylating ferredoxin subunit
MDTISLWKDITPSPPEFPALAENAEADVAIIGGGITGLSAAYYLMNEGKKVIVLEALSIGGGTTAFSTGNMYVATQPYFKTVKTKFDIETVKAVAGSRKFAIDEVERISREHNIECNFTRRPWYFIAVEESDNSKIEDEVDVLKEAGFQIDLTDDVPLSLKFTRAAVMQDSARFNPYMYVTGLAKHLADKGCLIYENSAVTEFEYNDKDKENETLSVGDLKVKAKYVIMATHIPKGINHVQVLAAPYRSYVVSARVNGSIPDINLWDTSKPHHAISTHSSKVKGEPDLLMVAGSHHKTGQPRNDDEEDYYRKIEKYMFDHFDIKEIVYKWSAQHYQAADFVPYIGLATAASERFYIASGYFADGLTYGAAAGKILSDCIVKKDNKWAKHYDSTRFTPLASAKEFIKENINELAQYIKDIPGNVEADDLGEITKGTGKIIEIDGEKYGAYRDDEEKLHVVSAVCTHMKCIVEFNETERSWDCPCHGSRFTYEGKIIEGPAMAELKYKRIGK